ncbi:hypothetical protein ACQYWQ_14320 [Streptomyces sp. P6-2-1]|uniref:hypothetical protein n=1 Tax=Streptomyces sp. P6-2-1 TaxID=3422591 RepID=UPI003D36E9BD
MSGAGLAVGVGGLPSWVAFTLRVTHGTDKAMDEVLPWPLSMRPTRCDCFSDSGSCGGSPCLEDHELAIGAAGSQPAGAGGASTGSSSGLPRRALVCGVAPAAGGGAFGLVRRREAGPHACAPVRRRPVLGPGPACATWGIFVRAYAGHHVLRPFPLEDCSP